MFFHFHICPLDYKADHTFIRSIWLKSFLPQLILDLYISGTLIRSFFPPFCTVLLCYLAFFSMLFSLPFPLICQFHNIFYCLSPLTSAIFFLTSISFPSFCYICSFPVTCSCNSNSLVAFHQFVLEVDYWKQAELRGEKHDVLVFLLIYDEGTPTKAGRTNRCVPVDHPDSGLQRTMNNHIMPGNEGSDYVTIFGAQKRMLRNPKRTSTRPPGP